MVQKCFVTLFAFWVVPVIMGQTFILLEFSIIAEKLR